jgi:hypothetical protein
VNVKTAVAASAPRWRVYVCHPFADAPAKNVVCVRRICRLLVEQDLLPIAPHLYLPQFIDETTEREHAIALCLELVELADELRVYGGRVTSGMRREIERARELGLPIRQQECAV